MLGVEFLPSFVSVSFFLLPFLLGFQYWPHFRSSASLIDSLRLIEFYRTLMPLLTTWMSTATQRPQHSIGGCGNWAFDWTISRLDEPELLERFWEKESTSKGFGSTAFQPRYGQHVAETKHFHTSLVNEARICIRHWFFSTVSPRNCARKETTEKKKRQKKNHQLYIRGEKKTRPVGALRFSLSFKN